MSAVARIEDHPKYNEGLWWKGADGLLTDSVYLYRGSFLLGVVRYWGNSVLATPGNEWSAYSSPDHQTYHATQNQAMAELQSRFQPAQHKGGDDSE